MTNHQDYPIIIMSCDSYSDVWEPMVYSIEKYWPDCPFPIYMCSEEKAFEHLTIKSLKVGRKMGWSEMLIEVLKKLDTPNVIYLQEDYILKGTCDTSAIEKILAFYQQQNASYLRLIPFPSPDAIINEELNIGVLKKGSQYRTSLQAAVWNREILLSLLDPSENGWQFERDSVARSNQINQPFYSLGVNSDEPNKNLHQYPLNYYSTAILQGKWQKEGVKMLRKAGIPIDTAKRGCLTRWDFYYYHQQKNPHSAYLKLLKWLDRTFFNRHNSYRKY